MRKMVNLKCLFGHKWRYSYSISIDEKYRDTLRKEEEYHDKKFCDEEFRNDGFTHAYPILRVYKTCSKCGKRKFLFSRYVKDYEACWKGLEEY